MRSVLGPNFLPFLSILFKKSQKRFNTILNFIFACLKLNSVDLRKIQKPFHCRSVVPIKNACDCNLIVSSEAKESTFLKHCWIFFGLERMREKFEVNIPSQASKIFF